MNEGIEQIVEAVKTAALKGDMVAAKIILDRIYPVRRGCPVPFSMSRLKSPADVVEAHATIVSVIADGSLTPSEAAEISQVIEGYTRALVASKSRPLNRIAWNGETPDPGFGSGSDMERVTAMKDILNRTLGPVR